MYLRQLLVATPRAAARAALLSRLLAVQTLLILGRNFLVALCVSRTVAHLRLRVRVCGSMHWHVEMFGCVWPQVLPPERFELALLVVVVEWRCLLPLAEWGC